MSARRRLRMPAQCAASYARALQILSYATFAMMSAMPRVCAASAHEKRRERCLHTAIARVFPEPWRRVSAQKRCAAAMCRRKRTRDASLRAERRRELRGYVMQRARARAHPRVTHHRQVPREVPARRPCQRGVQQRACAPRYMKRESPSFRGFSKSSMAMRCAPIVRVAARSPTICEAKSPEVRRRDVQQKRQR